MIQVLLVAVLALTMSCTLRDQYPPAMPAERTSWDNTPLVPVTPPEDIPYPSPTAISVPDTDAWQLVTKQARRQQATGSLTPMEETRRGAVIKPTREHTAYGTSAMIQYTYTSGKIYEIHTSPDSPTHLLLPPGERLAAPPAMNTEKDSPKAWFLGIAQMGHGDQRQEAVVVRPIDRGYETTTALLLQSGAVIFLRLMAMNQGMVSVSWAMPKPHLAREETQKTQKPPIIDKGRMYERYTITNQGKHKPPWMPIRVFDDGRRTYIQFQEALTFTRAPGAYGVTPEGKPALLQPLMYTTPGKPEDGAWLVINGLWPAIDLASGTLLKIRIVRQ